MTEQQAERVQIAKTILEQLGGNRFKAMTGANRFVALESGLHFRIPGGGFTKNGINSVTIILDWSDTYTVRFERVRGIKSTQINELSLVYDDQLQGLFEEETGLRTSL